MFPHNFSGNGDHFYTINEDEIGTTTAGETGNYNYKSEGVVGKCFVLDDGVAVPEGMVPLYRYINVVYTAPLSISLRE